MPQTRKQRQAAEGRTRGSKSPKTPPSLRGPAPAVQAPTRTSTPVQDGGVHVGLKYYAAETRAGLLSGLGDVASAVELFERVIPSLTDDEANQMREKLEGIKRDTAAQGASRKARIHSYKPLRDIAEAWPAFEHIFCYCWVELDPVLPPYVYDLAETGFDKADPSLESIRAQTLICALHYVELIGELSVLSEVSLSDVRRIRQTRHDATLLDLRERLWADAARFKIIYEMEIMDPDEEQEPDRARDYPFSRRAWMDEVRIIGDDLMCARTITRAKLLEDANFQYAMGNLEGGRFASWRETTMPQFQKVAAIKWSLIRANERGTEPAAGFELDEGLDLFEKYLILASNRIDWLDEFDTNTYLDDESDSDPDIVPMSESSPTGKNSHLNDGRGGSGGPLFGKSSLDPLRPWWRSSSTDSSLTGPELPPGHSRNLPEAGHFSTTTSSRSR